MATSITDADYVDCFRMAVRTRRPAREWARRSLASGSPLVTQVFGRVVWHDLLGFDLAERGAGNTLVGWAVEEDTDERFVLTVDGTLMAGRMEFEVDGDQVSWRTMLRFHPGRGRSTWGVLQHAHRALAPALLRRAAAGEKAVRRSGATAERPPAR